MPSKTQKHINVTINDLIQNTSLSNENSDIYSNYVLASITSNEIFIDFYYLSPISAKQGNVRTKHIQRAILPINLGKGLASALANVIASYEEDNNIVLPNSREKQEDDKIMIWE